MAEEILELQVNSNVKGVIKDVDNLTDAVESTNTSYKKLNRTVGKNNTGQASNNKLIMRGIENFRVFGFSIRRVRENFKLLGPISKKLFGTIKSGIKATGVGLLVIAFGTLLGALLGTKKGAKLLEAGMKVLKGIFTPFIWVIEKVADGLTWLFGIESTPAVTAAEELERAYEKLGREMDKIALREEKGKKAKFDNKKIIDDITKSEKERLKASKENAVSDKKILDDKIAAQQKVVDKAKKAQIQARKDWNWEKSKLKEGKITKEFAADKESGYFEDRAAHHKAIKKSQEAQIALTKLQTQAHTDAADVENEIFFIKFFNITKLADEEKKAADAWRTTQKKKADDELTIARQVEKIKNELHYRTLKTVRAVEIAKLVTQHKAAEQAIKDSKASKKVKDAAIKELEKKFTSDLNIIKKKHQDITDTAEEKLADLKEANRIKALEDETEQALALLAIQKDKEDEALKSFENYAELKLELDEKYLGLETDIKKKAREKQKKNDDAITKAEQDFKKATLDQTFGAAAAMAGENVALSKGVAVAQTIYSTQQGIMAAMGATSVADKLIPYPMRLANAIATGIMGTAAIAKIMSTDPSGGGAIGGVTAVAPPAPEMMSGAFELTSGQIAEPVQAYVVSDDITNNQNKLAIIRRRATI